MNLSSLKNPKNLMETAARILLGTVFIYASWDKILNPAGFAEAIGNYQILPPGWVNAAALMLPWIEMVCGISLICGRLVCGSALLAVGLFIVFIGALTYSAYRGLDIQCGCFSLDSSAKSNLYLDLFRDLVLLAIAFMVLLRWRRPARQGRLS